MPTENEKKWIAAWRSAGPELERIRREELANLDEEQGTRQAMMLGVSPELLKQKPRATTIGKLSDLLAMQTASAT
jgi:hypothetical protein